MWKECKLNPAHSTWKLNCYFVMWIFLFLKNDLYHTIEALTRIAHSRQSSEGCVRLFFFFSIYSYFEKGCRKKMCPRQSREVIWDMFNTLILTLWLSNLLLLLSFSTHRHMSMASPAILSNFFEKQWTQNHPQYLSGLSRALYPTTFLKIAAYCSWVPLIFKQDLTLICWIESYLYPLFLINLMVSC